MSEETKVPADFAGPEWEKVVVEMAPTYDFDQNPEISGVLIDVKNEVGPNKSMLYVLQQKNSTEIAVWGSAVLDDLMKKIMVGEEIKIVCTGKQTPKSGMKPYRLFEVFHRKMSV